MEGRSKMCGLFAIQKCWPMRWRPFVGAIIGSSSYWVSSVGTGRGYPRCFLLIALGTGLTIVGSIHQLYPNICFFQVSRCSKDANASHTLSPPKWSISPRMLERKGAFPYPGSLVKIPHSNVLEHSKSHVFFCWFSEQRYGHDALRLSPAPMDACRGLWWMVLCLPSASVEPLNRWVFARNSGKWRWLEQGWAPTRYKWSYITPIDGLINR